MKVRNRFIIREDFWCFKQKKTNRAAGLISQFTNRLIVTPTHDAYLENGTCIGLTVGKPTIAYAGWFVNMRKNFTLQNFCTYFGNSKVNLRMPASLSFLSSSS